MPEMDAAYHQGTAWPWLLGPYVSALVRVTGDKKEAKRILKNAKTMLTEFGLGGIAEVYDGDLASKRERLSVASLERRRIPARVGRRLRRRLKVVTRDSWTRDSRLRDS